MQWLAGVWRRGRDWGGDRLQSAHERVDAYVFGPVRAVSAFVRRNYLSWLQALVAVVLCSIVSLLCAVVLYLLVYYSFVPVLAADVPLYFQFDSKKERRPFVRIPIDSIEGLMGEDLHPGQPYSMELRLVLPDSPENVAVGMFMASMQLIGEPKTNEDHDRGGAVIAQSSRPSMLRYRSTLFRTIYTLFYALPMLFGWTTETQEIRIALFDRFVESAARPVREISLQLSDPAIQLLDAELHIRAQLSWLQSFMHRWFITSALLGVAILYCLSWLFLLFVWLLYSLTAADTATDTVDPPPRSGRRRLSAHSSPPRSTRFQAVALRDSDSDDVPVAATSSSNTIDSRPLTQPAGEQFVRAASSLPTDDDDDDDDNDDQSRRNGSLPATYRDDDDDNDDEQSRGDGSIPATYRDDDDDD